MGYLPYMKESIKRVEATRQQRVNETYPRASAEEKKNVLENFHPDYADAGFKEMKFGPNKGERMPNRFADVLEAKSVINPDEIDLDNPDLETDVLVIGGGGAGSAAALLAQENGADVLMTTKLRHGDANTMMAQGGIQAADKEKDSPARHYLDVIGGGHFDNIPELVEALVHDAPLVIKWLEELGVMFDKDEDGRMQTRHGGGTSRKRMHSAKDYSGAAIMRTLRDEVRNKGIEVIEFAPAVELILDDKGQCAGAVLYHLETKKYSVVKAKTTILATGGIGRLHIGGFATTNHYGATADGLVMAYRAGAELAFMDSLQYHPTGSVFPEQTVGLLITEKVRGLGAQEINDEGEEFVNPLETRDVSAASIIRECEGRGKGIETPSGLQGVWLDSPLIDLKHGEGTIEKELPAMVRQFRRFGIDITKEPMLVYPTLHYQNGGILINEEGETGIENLFVAGEAAGGIHGRNRLMGNSLLDIVVFGRRAGRNAAAKVGKVKQGELNLNHVRKYHHELEEAGIKTDRVSPQILPDYTPEETKKKTGLV
ncbi:MAG: L-aspartate oxidase, partial [Candidatus Frackibacter sp. T328-2]